MKYELSHDTIAKQIFEKSSVEAKTRRKIKLLVERAHERHQNNARILLSKEDLEEIKPFESVIQFSKEEEHFLQKSKWAINRQRSLLWGLTAIVLLTLAALSIWALSEKNRVEKARQVVEAEKTRATSILLASKAREADNEKDGTQALQFAAYSTRLDINEESRDILYEQFYQAHRHYYRKQLPHPYQEKGLQKVMVTAQFPYQYFFLYADGQLMKSDEALVNFEPVFQNYSDISGMAEIPGKAFFVLSHLDSLTLISSESLTPQQSFKAGAPIAAFVVSGDGKTLLSTSNKNVPNAAKEVLVWDLFGTDQPIDTLSHNSPVLNIAISADGQLFATETTSSIYLWSHTGDLLNKVNKKITLETGLFFYPQNNQEDCYYLIKPPSPFKPNSLSIYEWCGHQLTDRTESFGWKLPPGELGTMALSPNGALAISGSQSPIFYFRPFFDQYAQLQLGRSILQLDRRKAIYEEHLLFHPNGHQLLSIGKEVTVWELSAEFRPYSGFLPESGQTNTKYGLCNLYPYWWTFTNGSADLPQGQVKIFRAAEVNPVIERTFKQSDAPLIRIASTGTIAFFAEANNELVCYDSSGQMLYQKNFPALEPDFIDLDQSGDHLLIGSQKNNHLTILNRQGENVFERTFSFNLFNAIFSPSNWDQCYLTGSSGNGSFLYHLQLSTGKMDSVTSKSYLDRSLSISEDGKRILLVGSNHIEVLDSLLSIRFSIHSEDATFSMARLSPNGNFLIVIDSDNAQLIDMKHSEEPLVSLEQVEDAVLSEEGKQLITLSILPNSGKKEPLHQLRIWPFGVKNVMEQIEQMQLADLPENIKTLYGLK